jgi:hypothetical protein
MQVKPKRSIIPRKPAPELAAVLAIQEQRRPRSIQEQCNNIQAQIERLRAATYLLLLKHRQR